MRRLGRGLGRTFGWFAEGIARLVELIATFVVVSVEQVVTFPARVRHAVARRRLRQIERDADAAQQRQETLQGRIEACKRQLGPYDELRMAAEEAVAAWVGTDVAHGALQRKWETDARHGGRRFDLDTAKTNLQVARGMVAHLAWIDDRISDSAGLDTRRGELIGPSLEVAARATRLENTPVDELVRNVDDDPDPWDSLDFIVLTRIEPETAHDLVTKRIEIARRDAAQVASVSIAGIHEAADPILRERAQAVNELDTNATRLADLAAERDVRRADVARRDRRLPEPPGPRLHRAAIGEARIVLGIAQLVGALAVITGVVYVLANADETGRTIAAFAAIVILVTSGALLARALAASLTQRANPTVRDDVRVTAVQRPHAPDWAPLTIAVAIVLACLIPFAAAGVNRGALEPPSWFDAVSTVAGLTGIALVLIALLVPLARRSHSGVSRFIAGALLVAGVGFLAWTGATLAPDLRLADLKITAIDRWITHDHQSTKDAASTPQTTLPPPPPPPGFWGVTRNGTVYAWHLPNYKRVLTGPIIAADASTGAPALWMLDAHGDVHVRGGARHFGDVEISHLAPGERPASISVLPNGTGYWIVTNRGRVAAFGKAKRYGGLASEHLNAPIVASAASPSGRGYLLVSADGGVFAFGDARFHGSHAGVPLSAPIVDVVLSRNGTGYWLIGSDGSVHPYGAPFQGSVSDERIGNSVVGGFAAVKGYVLVTRSGELLNFSPARLPNDAGKPRPQNPIVAIAAKQPASR